MPLPKPHGLALLMLMSTDSNFRRSVEGIPINPSTPGAGAPPTAAEFVRRFKTAAAAIGIDPTTLSDFKITGLWVKPEHSIPSRPEHNSVTTDTYLIAAAVDLEPYDPTQGPCPDYTEEGKIVAGLSSQAW